MGMDLGRAMVHVTADNRTLRPGLAQSRQTVQKAMADISKSVGIATTAIAGMGAAVIGFGLKSAASLEDSRIAFGVILRDVELAKSVLADLSDFAASTPFQLPALTDASKSLLAFGFSAEKLLPTLRSIGDLSAGLSIPIGDLAEIYGKARVQGRLFAEDVNQLTGRGIPIIQEFAKQFGVAESEVKGLVESGEIGFPQLEKAFQDMTKEGGQFFNMMDAKSKGLNGMLSTLKDNLSKVTREIAEPLLGAVKSLTAQSTKVVQSIGKIATTYPQITSGIVAGSTAAAGFTASILAARAAAVALGISLRAALIGTGVGAILVAAGAAVGAIIVGVKKLVKWLQTTVPVQEALQRNAEKFRESWDRIKTAAVSALDSITKMAFQLVGIIADSLGIEIEKLPETFAEFSALFIDGLAELSTVVADVAEDIAYAFRNAFDLAKLAVIDFVDTTITRYQNLLHVLDLFGVAGAVVGTAAQQAVNKAHTDLGEARQSIYDSMGQRETDYENKRRKKEQADSMWSVMQGSGRPEPTNAGQRFLAAPTRQAKKSLSDLPIAKIGAELADTMSGLGRNIGKQIQDSFPVFREMGKAIEWEFNRLVDDLEFVMPEKQKPQFQTEPAMVSGTMGYAAFGAAIQDAILRDNTPKIQLQETKKQTGIQERTARAVEQLAKKEPGGLPEGA